jgi:hypothetical protein
MKERGVETGRPHRPRVAHGDPNLESEDSNEEDGGYRKRRCEVDTGDPVGPFKIHSVIVNLTKLSRNLLPRKHFFEFL